VRNKSGVGFAAAAVAAVALAAASCASMPTHGAIHLGRAVSAPGGLADLDVRVLPPSWHAGMAPGEVVAGFLRALVNDDDDYAIARSYLTPGGMRSWHPDKGITTYDDTSSRTSVSGSRVTIRAPRLGRIDQRGGYEPMPGTLASTFTMTKISGSWRIDKLADGVLLSATDAQRAFRLANVYYLNRSGTTVVPDQVLLQGSQRGIATALMSALLAGPSAWVAPAVHTALPSGTALIGTVPVHDDGVADVNLSASVRSASPQDLMAASAQITWTLRQVPGVTGVRLFADGAPLSAPGVPARQPVASWPSYDPSAPPATGALIYVTHQHLRATGSSAATIARSDPGHVVSAAESRDGSVIAVVRQVGAQQDLLVGRPGERLERRLTATTMSAPTFDVDGAVVTVVNGAGGRRVVAIDRDGHSRMIATDADLSRNPVTSLRISRDGSRVAAVVGSGALLVGRVAGRGSSEAFGGFRAVLPGAHSVEGVSWSDADTLVVTAVSGSSRRDVVETDTAGYFVRIVDTVPVHGRVVNVAAAPGRPLVVATETGELWSSATGWVSVAPGGAPAYAG
jgi:hypothetical protein